MNSPRSGVRLRKQRATVHHIPPEFWLRICGQRLPSVVDSLSDRCCFRGMGQLPCSVGLENGLLSASRARNGWINNLKRRWSAAHRYEISGVILNTDRIARPEQRHVTHDLLCHRVGSGDVQRTIRKSVEQLLIHYFNRKAATLRSGASIRSKAGFQATVAHGILQWLRS
jgi:hypothetical protein